MKKTFRYHWWGILWGFLIVILTALPGDMIPEIPSFANLFEPDKLVHVFLFAGLIFILIRGFTLHEGPVFYREHAVSISLNIGILLGGLTELMQKYFITGRVASIYDFIANVIGCFLGWWMFHIWMTRKQAGSNK